MLLVRLHLIGFCWGDVSLSNTLFRRDAGAFAAYLVDAETGELHAVAHRRPARARPRHRPGQHRRRADGPRGRRAARGEARPDRGLERIVERYTALWAELTETERFERGDRWRVEERIRRLNDLGFDVDELAISTDLDGTTIPIQPKVVDAGHHSRRLLRLTGLDVEENQARRLLNDLDSFQAATDRQNDDEEIVAHDWLARVYEPTVRAVPRELAGKLEPAEVFHEVLEHRWYMSERAGHDVTVKDAVHDYLRTVLPAKPDEQSVLGVDTVEMPVLASGEVDLD